MPSPALIVLFGVVVAGIVLQYVQQRIRRRRHAQSLGCRPPAQGNRSFFGIQPFIEMAKAFREKQVVEHLAKQYGKYGNTHEQLVLGRAVISTIEPENIKAVLATKFNDFGLGSRHREFFPLLGDGIFTLDSGGWSHSRGLLRPQFTRDQVADLNLMEGHVSQLIELIPKDGSSFDIQPLFFELTLDSSTHFLFGEGVGALHRMGGVLGKTSVGNAEGFAEAFNAAQEYLALRTRAGNFYWAFNSKSFQEHNKRVHEVVDYYVRLALQRRTHADNKHVSTRYIFADALAEDTQDPKELRDQMLNILLAGRDTTASLLSSTIFFLARDPGRWDKLRLAILEEFGDTWNPKGEITQGRLKDVPYLRHVLSEVLRLMPPVSINFRVANKDTSLPVGGGADGKSPIFVTKGQPVVYSVWAMHRRTDLYGADASVFRPERWEEDGRHGWEYLPFNGGPRICLGQQYALTEASYVIVRLMQRFDTLKCADPELKKPVIQSSLTISHDRGVKVNLVSSRSSDVGSTKY
ncbi:cytochrome P450 [Aspergillus pseudoustus]|uniref:Cytochrome P450 n=1 Tax=Aspergillus pseudoustus TaxID=1810923 RepID=A0ABR4JAM5_9EURO